MSKFILKHNSTYGNLITFELPENPYKSKILQIIEKCHKNCNGYVSLDIQRPYKPRTTGLNSQNNYFWKIVTLIAEESGDDSEGMKDTEKGLKMRALAKGYPFHINKITGEKEPESTTKVNTMEMSYLIDTAIQVASEFGIVLDEKPPMEIVESKVTETLVQEAFNELEIF